MISVRPRNNDKKMQVNYSVYLVTDNTPAILGDKDIVEVVRAAVEGGSTNAPLNTHACDIYI